MGSSSRVLTVLFTAGLFLAVATAPVSAANLKPGTCRGISTSNGYKYVGTYCVDFQCTVTTTMMFDSFCPFSI